jgi:beta-lactamase class A
MTFAFDRRSLLLGLPGLALACASRSVSAAAADPAAELAAIEARTGGRLGVAVLDTRDGGRFGHRADERFAFCSTAKALLAGLIFARVDRGEESLSRRVPFTAADLVEYSPVTAPWAPSGGARLGDLLAAAVVHSDNTAANLMFAALGGPDKATAAIRAIGDTVTRFDRIETALNSAIPGDDRDTTTPNAMVADLERFIVGDVLKPTSRDRLIGLMVSSSTGAKRLRAAAPDGWLCGDKTGSGANGTANDIAFFRPPGRPSVLIATFLTGTTIAPPERDAAIAAVGRLVVGRIAAV